MNIEATEQEFDKFLLSLGKLFKGQPSAADLDASDKFLRNLNVMYARWAQLDGKAQGLLAVIMHEQIKSMSEDDYKKIKSSSTLTTSYIEGSYPEICAKAHEVKNMGYVIRTTADNYRTLISSYRKEREYVNGAARNTEVIPN